MRITKKEIESAKRQLARINAKAEAEAEATMPIEYLSEDDQYLAKKYPSQTISAARYIEAADETMKDKAEKSIWASR